MPSSTCSPSTFVFAKLLQATWIRVIEDEAAEVEGLVLADRAEHRVGVVVEGREVRPHAVHQCSIRMQGP
jgi:hypothetical protein